MDWAALTSSRYPSLASEVLSCASWQLIDALSKPVRAEGKRNGFCPLWE
jgi:hypothetical protein